MQERALVAVKRSHFLCDDLFYYIIYIEGNTSMFWTSMKTETSNVLHFRNCTLNCSNSLRALELTRALTNPSSQICQLNNPAF
jgi:hypothetical protein